MIISHFQGTIVVPTNMYPLWASILTQGWVRLGNTCMCKEIIFAIIIYNLYNYIIFNYALIGLA